MYLHRTAKYLWSPTSQYLDQGVQSFITQGHVQKKKLRSVTSDVLKLSNVVQTCACMDRFWPRGHSLDAPDLGPKMKKSDIFFSIQVQ